MKHEMSNVLDNHDFEVWRGWVDSVPRAFGFPDMEKDVVV